MKDEGVLESGSHAGIPGVIHCPVPGEPQQALLGVCRPLCSYASTESEMLRNKKSH